MKNKPINGIELTVGVLCIIYYFVCVISVGPNVSLLYIWLAAGILLMVKAGGCLLFWDHFCKGRKWVRLFLWRARSYDRTGDAVVSYICRLCDLGYQ